MNKQLKAMIEIFIASIFWGFGFIATVWAMQEFTASLTMVYRFLLATVLSVVVILIRKNTLQDIKNELKYGAIAGFMMGTMLLFQAYGLETTTATKNSFITSFYIFFVPLIAFIIFKKKIFFHHIALIALALFGSYLLFDMELQTIQVGDVWTLVCSIIAAIHILYIGHVSKKTSDAFLFNSIQGFFAFITVTVSLFFEPQKAYVSSSVLVWGGIFFLATFSSLIAFFLHVKSQKIISDSTISMMCLLEAPFASFFAFLFLSEKLSFHQSLGTACILAASLTQCYLESRKNYHVQLG